MNILIVDKDEPLIKEIHNCSLNKNFNLIYCNEITNIKKIINNKNPEIIVFDLDNLSNSKIKSFKYVKSLTNKPIIVISFNNNTDEIVLFFSLGADDYMVKPLNTKELIMRIQAIYNRNK